MSDAYPIQIGKRDLWLLGIRYEVDHAVLAHINFLTDLNSQFADRIGVQAEELNTFRREEIARRAGGVRWTPALKERLAKLSQQGGGHRAAVMLVCEISGDELDGWIARYARFGFEGLKGTRLQALGRGARR